MALLRRILRKTVISLVVIFALLWVATLFLRYPNPIAAARLGLAMPSATVKLMPSNAIAATKPVTLGQASAEALPTEVSWWQGPTVKAGLVPAGATRKNLTEFLTETKTNAFIVMRDGKVTYEWYAPGITKQTQLPSYSVAKTVVGILAGQAIAAGKLKESDTFVSMFPQFKSGNDFDTVTLGQLLDMKGGVDVIDDYPSGPAGWFKPVAQMYATTDMMFFLRGHHKMLYTPGSRADYRSIDAQLAGMMVRKATGKSLADLMATQVFPQMGAEFPASWGADRKGGIERGFCCLNMAARDYAKLGQLFVTGGTGPNGRVIDPVWFERLRYPSVPSFGENKWGYGAFMWHPRPDALFMTGLNGQYVLAVPSLKTVVVKLSDDTIGGVTAQSFQAMFEVANNVD